MYRSHIKKIFWVMVFMLSCIAINLNAETGSNTYRFLNLPYSAKLAGLGGENITVRNSQAGQIYANPALFSGDMKNALSATYVNYFADANGGMFSYTYTQDSLNYFGFNFLFWGYGDFEGYDKDGIATTDFSVGDFAWNLVYARNLGAGFTVGLAMKPIYSHIDVYNSFGLGFDVGGNYYNEKIDLSVSLVAKSFGFRFTGYYEGQQTERLPWNLQVGVTKRLAHAPFRFSVTYDYLNDWNFDYDRIKDYSTGEVKKIKGGDMFFRHLTFGLEILFGKVFHVDVGYNHRRNREYALEKARAINGFSFGAGFKVYKFNLDAAYAQYAPSGGAFTLTLSTSIDSFRK